MKRRTNLFYTDQVESNFITFSNYAEHLTGVVLATDFKLFPSRFLCMHIPGINDEASRKIFIEKYLMCYYENKLAMLRDKVLQDKTNISISHPDQKLNYLGYLLDVIDRYGRDFDVEPSIKYISTITEQDYNGTYTDIICTIESSNTFSEMYVINKTSILTDSEKIEINESNAFDDATKLYGWSMNNGALWLGPNEYKDMSPLFDNDTEEGIHEYLFKPFSQTIQRYQIPINEQTQSITFNVIIPLYDVVLFNPKTNETIVGDDYDDKFDTGEKDYINVNNATNAFDYAQNVPYGMWFANEDILLKKDKYTEYAPSWSLLIGTQFKPFPNSKFLVSDVPGTANKENIYATFAEILSKQNTLYDQWERNFTTITEIQNQVQTDILEKIAELKTIVENINVQSKEEITKIIEITIKSLLESSGSGTPLISNHKWEWVQANI